MIDERHALNEIAADTNTVALDKPTIARLAYDGLIVSRTCITLTELGERVRAHLNARHEHNNRGKATTQ